MIMPIMWLHFEKVHLQNSHQAHATNFILWLVECAVNGLWVAAVLHIWSLLVGVCQPPCVEFQMKVLENSDENEVHFPLSEFSTHQLRFVFEWHWPNLDGHSDCNKITTKHHNNALVSCHTLLVVPLEMVHLKNKVKFIHPQSDPLNMTKLFGRDQRLRRRHWIFASRATMWMNLTFIHSF